MPQNFGLLIGTEADAEARLKASVNMPNYYTTRKYKWHGITIYEFSDPKRDGTLHAVRQRGAVRCVSRDLKLIRQWRGAPFPLEANAPFLVEEKSNPHLNGFAFHPITPQAHFITEERSDPS